MNYRYCLGQDGHALQRNVDTLLLAVKQADGCEPRHVRCDRKRKRSFSGLSFCFVSDFRMPETSNWLVVIYSGHQIAETRT